MKSSRFIILVMVSFCMALHGCKDYGDNDLVEAPVAAPHLNKTDSLALIHIYEAIGPWHGQWDYADITSWNGVEVALDEDTNELRCVGFEVYGGQFRGQFPSAFCQLTELRRLALTGGFLTGAIPDSIGNLKHLEWLTVAENYVSGSIPESIGQLTALRYLRLGENQLSGPIPASIGNLTQLEYLYISNTDISGPVPSGLANMPCLDRVTMRDCKLSGAFPVEVLKGKENPIVMLFEGNNIDALPFEVWDDSFDGLPPNLQRNRLSGEVPEWVRQTAKWKDFGQWCTGGQQEGFGYRLNDN